MITRSLCLSVFVRWFKTDEAAILRQHNSYHTQSLPHTHAHTRIRKKEGPHQFRGTLWRFCMASFALSFLLTFSLSRWLSDTISTLSPAYELTESKNWRARRDIFAWFYFVYLFIFVYFRLCVKFFFIHFGGIEPAK